ncbi:hypothetical protein PF005_g22925 [Phytophthora fragariae]|uniref:Uncharacterized protein n=1 Tax=Phytophthora fragariae TaxID=53985 RepID=A0A6A4C2G6_9STRA|nr:hypothetical protein PF003_g12859 [Phytophthora fragariae]KAE8926151.1 hypothetical protein PF009_g23651 [Phytophthora fragariae]KAE8990524.1 hypothetical protein PF011_g18322 [Phytophthora fragariae]KAE9080690.1 hypothetical protein PF007_g22946 [Phytophthora fragariae]KAE9081140.1 hypothetical protein PF010_g22104 [Phytophthora fragariae]
MAEVATSFPALARAKKLFLLRKRAARHHEAQPIANSKLAQGREVSTANSPEDPQERARRAGSEVVKCRTSSLMALCSDFDEQLKLIKSDVLLVSASVRREYQRESSALEKLTSTLLDGQVAAPEAAQRAAATRRRVRLRVKRPCVKLRVAVKSAVKAVAAVQPLTSPKTLSRAAQLARQAVKACILQSYTRLYLYRCLYRGGTSQLAAAAELASRCRRSKAFRQWRRVATQRAKLRLRCRRAQQRVERVAASWAQSRAADVVESEGKYAMAKEFQQCKLLARSFQTWLGVV